VDGPKAIAAAAAITMSLVSGVVAVGANFGALGFTGASTVSSGSQTSVIATPSTAQPTTANTATSQRQHDDTTRAVQQNARSATSTRGEHDG
jgi:type IV secretory pathway VirB6-like protein